MSARRRFWEPLDDVAHFLHTPLMLGHRVAVARWYHRLHLLPGWALRPICDRFDLSLGMTWDEIRRKAPPRIVGWTCPHVTITSLPGLLTSVTTSSCACELQPIYERSGTSCAG